MRKYIRGNLKEKGRNISRMAIAKICVGITLSVDEADKLFRLEGHSLKSAPCHATSQSTKLRFSESKLTPSLKIFRSSAAKGSA